VNEGLSRWVPGPVPYWRYRYNSYHKARPTTASFPETDSEFADGRCGDTE